MTLSLFQTNIPKRNDICAKGLEAIKPGETYYSILLEDKSDIRRQDFCIECWRKFEKNGTLPSEVYWKSRAKHPSEKEVKIKSKDRESRALDLLKQVINENSAESKAEAFILALFLARRRWLYLRQQIKEKDCQIIYLYEVAATEEMIAVTRIPLSQIEIPIVQERLASKLS